MSSSSRIRNKEQDKEDVEHPTKRHQPSPTVVSPMLIPFMNCRIIYASRKNPSSYYPSCHMMDYIVHLINYNLVDNFRFKRSCPDYHPYILRLYYAVIFWIQCLRAARDVTSLSGTKHQFLSYFLDTFPPERLPIAGPLIPLFQTICSSQPEFSNYGKVYPILPSEAGPRRRDAFMRDSIDAHFLPNVPGIFALLEHLNSLINADQPKYPKKGKHIPVTSVTSQPIIFGHHSFPILDKRTDFEAWSLVSPGLQYPCEADAKLNESFAERYSSFNFPLTAPTDDLRSLDKYLSMDVTLAWFPHVLNVASSVSDYFEGSGMLSDCPPYGVHANQIIVALHPNHEMIPPARPTKSADEASLYPFSFYLSSSCRSPPTLSEAMASMAQTNISMSDTHPYLASFGLQTRAGEFWDIRPIERSPTDYSSYLGITPIIKKMMKFKI